MSVCEYHMRLFLMDYRLALACMQHAADGESKQSITASPLVVSSLLSSLPLPSVSHEHLHFKNSLIKMNVSFSSLAGGYKDAPWIRQDRSALNLQVLKRKKTVIEPQLVCNFCKWALWQPKSKWVYYIMQSNSENIGNHYRPVTRFIQSTNFPFNISCPVLLTRFKVSWYSWPSPLSLSLIYRKDEATSGLAPVLLAPVEPFSMKALAPSAADNLSRCTGARPHIWPVDGVELEDSHPLKGFNRRPAVAQSMKGFERCFCSGNCES